MSDYYTALDLQNIKKKKKKKRTAVPYRNSINVIILRGLLRNRKGVYIGEEGMKVIQINKA